MECYLFSFKIKYKFNHKIIPISIKEFPIIEICCDTGQAKNVIDLLSSEVDSVIDKLSEDNDTLKDLIEELKSSYSWYEVLIELSKLPGLCAVNYNTAMRSLEAWLGVE